MGGQSLLLQGLRQDGVGCTLGLWIMISHHAPFLPFPTKHVIEWVAQPEKPNKYLLMNIMERTLMAARCLYPTLLPVGGGPNVILILCLWKISWHSLFLEALLMLHLASCCLPEFPVWFLPSRGPHFQEKESSFLLISVQTEEGINKTSRNHPARRLE